MQKKSFIFIDFLFKMIVKFTKLLLSFLLWWLGIFILVITGVTLKDL